jgi:hypothetical protein
LREWFERLIYLFDFNVLPVYLPVGGRTALKAKGWGQEVVSG